MRDKREEAIEAKERLERENRKKKGNKEKSNEKVQDKEPLKFFVQIGDCNPHIYNIVIGFNPEIDYAGLKFDENLLKGIVEDTNKALVPVLKRYVKQLKKANK